MRDTDRDKVAHFFLCVVAYMRRSLGWGGDVERVVGWLGLSAVLVLGSIFLPSQVLPPAFWSLHFWHVHRRLALCWEGGLVSLVWFGSEGGSVFAFGVLSALEVQKT